MLLSFYKNTVLRTNGIAYNCVSGADTQFKLLDRVVSDASFLTGGVFECDIAHRRSI